MEEKTTNMVKKSNTTNEAATSKATSGLTKREFLRKAIVGGAVAFVAAGGYVRPELETLQGPQVAHATGSHSYNKPSYKRKFKKISKKFSNNKKKFSSKKGKD